MNTENATIRTLKATDEALHTNKKIGTLRQLSLKGGK